MLAEERIERYELLGELATGGMATVYLGRQHGPFGFARTVAIKSMHPQLAKDEGFRAMFLDEATLTAKIRHPNVVPTLDIVCAESKLLLVMEYVDGVSLASLLRAAAKRGMAIPPPIAVAIVTDALHGLHAAHELVDDQGQPLGVIHRDVSPQNIHVGTDGMARILDFGVAKAASRRYATETNEIKGKIAYMSPEQLCGEPIDRRSDVYAAGVVAWESLTTRRLFGGANNEGELVKKILEGKIQPPGFVSDSALPPAVDRVVMKALAKLGEDRWATAADMARELAEAVAPASRAAVIAFVQELAGEELTARAKRFKASSPIRLEPEAKVVADLLTAQVTRTEPRGSARGRRIVVALGALAAVGALTGGAFVVGSRSAKARQVERPAAAATAEPPASVSAPVTASASASEAPAIASVSAPVPRPRPLSVKPGGTRSRPAVDCRVKFTVDANGDRHYKPECVE